MGKDSGIAWTDNTWNGWWGCTEVSPACDFCYARVWSARHGRAKWGVGEPRSLNSDKYWNEPYRWDRVCERDGTTKRVFCQSMSDFFDNEVPDAWRERAWPMIRDTKNLRWMILTKRIGNAEKMLPKDWGPAYSHVGFMATLCNQAEANRDLPKLLALKAERNVSWVGVSMEPLLGPVNLRQILYRDEDRKVRHDALNGESWIMNSSSPSAYEPDGPKLDLVIVGGESGKESEARPFVIEHARTLANQCETTATAFFLKQLGRKPTLGGKPFPVKDKAGADMAEFPEDLKIQQMPAQLQ